MEVLCATRKHLFVLQSFALLLYPSSTFENLQIPSSGIHRKLSLLFLGGSLSLSLSVTRHRPEHGIAKKFDVCRGLLDFWTQDELHLLLYVA